MQPNSGPRRAIRNVAIIAHVDHGKTTLVDQLLRQSGHFQTGELVGDCILDSNPLERERGITIFAKNCAIDYTDRSGGRYHINIVDTPGHADFSGEVERVLMMADGVLLLVDAVDGVMPQTRYVLAKALAAGLRPVVVVNKMDRPEARPHEVVEEVFDLLCELNADDATLDFPTVYASARDGWALLDPAQPTAGADFHALFETVIANVPPPSLDPDAPLQAFITTLDYSEYVGRIGIGRVFAGTLKAGMPVAVVNRHGDVRQERVTQLFRFDGLGRRQVEQIDVGDLCAVVGVGNVDIGDTLADPEHPTAHAKMTVDEPTLQMSFRVNDSPFAGREGRWVTGRQIRARLDKELQTNVALRVQEKGDECIVSGRGLLHLGILLENMRREGFEVAIGKPEVICKVDEAGRRLEPLEHLVVDVPTPRLGSVMELVGERRGDVVKMEPRNLRTQVEFVIPARGLIGLTGRLMTATQGEAVAHHRFHAYGEFRGVIPGRATGVLIATDTGKVTTHALETLQNRGVIFVVPGEQVYEGQIVGEHCKGDDVSVNAAKLKKLSNMRQALKEQTVVLKTPRPITLEYALEYIEDDELVEMTPVAIRMRKRILEKGARALKARRELNAAEQED